MNIVLISAKYAIILFFALFVITSFRAQKDVSDEKKKSVYSLQKTFLILVHAFSFLCIVLHAYMDDLSFKWTDALIFYAAQLAYFLIMMSFIPHIAKLSRGLNNVMCMFLAIGMIVQTRLNFSASVRQFFMMLAATVVFLIFVFFCKRTSFLHRLTWVYCVIGLGLLMAVLVLSTVTKGAKISLDFAGFSFQPMEFVKIVFVLFVAAAFNKANTFKTVVITAIFAAMHIIILVFCRDLGSALILFAIYVFMLYVATKKARYLILGGGAFCAASVLAYHLFSHVRVRIQTWQDPWADIDNKGYQISQALFAIGTGGWFGVGILNGSPGYIPEVSNDMVFAAISEEFGGVFAICLILLCLCFVIMMMRVAIRLEYRFYKLLAFGIGIAYIFQVFLNIGGTTKFIPLTGVNLPFISSGGSSMLSSMIMIAVIQALYIISEGDVQREKLALANGIDIRGYYDDPVDKIRRRKKDEKEPVYADEDIYREERKKRSHREDRYDGRYGYDADGGRYGDVRNYSDGGYDAADERYGDVRNYSDGGYDAADERYGDAGNYTDGGYDTADERYDDAGNNTDGGYDTDDERYGNFKNYTIGGYDRHTHKNSPDLIYSEKRNIGESEFTNRPEVPFDMYSGRKTKGLAPGYYVNDTGEDMFETKVYNPKKAGGRDKDDHLILDRRHKKARRIKQVDQEDIDE